MTSFEQRLEIRKHFRPTDRYAFEHLGVVLEVFMRDRQANEPVAVWLDIESDTRMFRIVLGVLGSRPCDNQASWREDLDDLPDNVDCARTIGASVLPFRTGLPIGHILMGRVVVGWISPILTHDTRVDQCLPRLLRRRCNIGYVHEARLSHRRHPPISSWDRIITRP